MWLYGYMEENKGIEGWFPSNYVIKITNTDNKNSYFGRTIVE